MSLKPPSTREPELEAKVAAMLSVLPCWAVGELCVRIYNSIPSEASWLFLIVSNPYHIPGLVCR